jgi:SAM-dependent methyltransferase
MSQKIIKREKITRCRICKSDHLETIIILPQMPFTDEFISGDKKGTEFLGDIEIAVCKSCGSAQNMNNTDMSEYYFEYTYSVQASNFAIGFMQTLATRVKETCFKNSNHPKILEIGSGSGEQLLEFKKLGFEVLGIEPSEKLSQYAESIGVKTLTAFFDETTFRNSGNGYDKVDAIVTSYTFDHIPQIAETLENIYNVLNANGILIIEVHDLDKIRDRNEYCLFEHEHYTYLNQATMTQLLNQKQFGVITFDLLTDQEKRGNSLLVIARKGSGIKMNSANPVEEASKLVHLRVEIEDAIQRIDEWLYENRDQKIAAYGAGGRGIMTIAALKRPELIRYIVDKNPKAPDIFAPKSHLPVYKIDELGNNPVDKILVFSYGYYDEIVNEIGSEYGYKPDQFISILTLLRKVND